MKTEEQIREAGNEYIEEIRGLNAQLSGALVAGDINEIVEYACLLNMVGIALATVNEILK